MEIFVVFVLLVSVMVLSISSVQSQDICNFTVSVNQRLRQNGFHRNIIYEMKIENSDKQKEMLHLYDECWLAVKQLVPSGIYVDPDELENLRSLEVVHVIPQYYVNVETAEPFSRPFNLVAYAYVNMSRAVTWSPVHARYQSAVEGGGYAENTIDWPRSIHIRCNDDRLKHCTKQRSLLLCELGDVHATHTCPWEQVAMRPTNKPLKWLVPVGNVDHLYAIETVTALVVVSSFLILSRAILGHKMTKTINCMP